MLGLGCYKDVAPTALAKRIAAARFNLDAVSSIVLNLHEQNQRVLVIAKYENIPLQFFGLNCNLGFC